MSDENEVKDLAKTAVVTTTTVMSVLFVIWLTLNIVGTVYYAKLGKSRQTPLLLTSVILGWLVLPPLNLASPIVYAMKS